MPDKQPDPYLVGITMLSRRELTSAQLREKLQRKGFAPDEIATAEQRLRDCGALDDERAAHAIARAAAHVKTQGRHRALRELQARGLDRDLSVRVIEQVYEEVDSRALLERALARRLTGRIETRQQLRRLYQYLVRQGFDSDSARHALMARADLVKE